MAFLIDNGILGISSSHGAPLVLHLWIIHEQMSLISLHDLPEFENKATRIQRRLLEGANKLRRGEKDDMEGVEEDINKLELMVKYKDEFNIVDDRRRLVVDKLRDGLENIRNVETRIEASNVTGEERGGDSGEQPEQEQGLGQGQEQQQQQQQQQQQHEFVVYHEPVNAEEIERQHYEAVQREVEINKIVNSVGELNQIFHDLDTLVNNQGELIDNIESNIYSALDNSRNAARELYKADRWDRKRRRCSYLVAIVGVFFLLIVMVILV